MIHQGCTQIEPTHTKFRKETAACYWGSKSVDFQAHCDPIFCETFWKVVCLAWLKHLSFELRGVNKRNMFRWPVVSWWTFGQFRRTQIAYSHNDPRLLTHMGIISLRLFGLHTIPLHIKNHYTSRTITQFITAQGMYRTMPCESLFCLLLQNKTKYLSEMYNFERRTGHSIFLDKTILWRRSLSWNNHHS